MFSIVVPTYRRGALLSLTLDGLLAQVADVPFEIVVVDNNSPDETAAVVRAYAARSAGQLRSVLEAAPGSSAARNAGIAASRGDVIVFIDDDIVVEAGWLQALVDAYRAHPDAWAVGGKVVLRLPRELPSWFDPAPGDMTTYLSRQDHGDETVLCEPPHALISANFSVRSDVLSAVGRFDRVLGRFGPRLLCGEDIEMCRRIRAAGGRLYYAGRACAIHLVPRGRVSKRFLRERAYWQGRTNGLLIPTNRRRLWWRAVEDGRIVLTDWSKALGHVLTGDGRRAFVHELSAWKHLGHLHQVVLQPRTARGGQPP